MTPPPFPASGPTPFRRPRAALPGLLVLAMLAASAGRADDAAEAFDRAVSLNPLRLLFGELAGQYEQRLTPSTSFTAGASGSHAAVGAYASSTAGVLAAWRYYPGGAALHHWYIAPGASMDFGWSAATPDAAREHGMIFALGAEGGYQWIWPSGFLLDLAAGGAYAWDTGTAGFGGSTVGLSDAGIQLILRCALGWAWR